jgi:hypothetical protein
MARRSTPERIETARRAATIARLISSGRSAAESSALVAEWEAALGRSPGRDDWERFDLWLNGRRRPPTRGPPQFPQGATFRQFSTTSLTVCVPVVP